MTTVAPKINTINSYDEEKKIAQNSLKNFKKLNLNKDIGNYLENNTKEFLLMDDMNIGVYLLDHSAEKYLYINDYLIRLLGCKRSDLMDTGINGMEKFIHPEDINCLLEILNQAAKVVQKLEEVEKKSVSFKINYRIKAKKGGYFWIMQMNKFIHVPEIAFPIDLGYIISVPHNSNFKEIIGFLSSNTNSWEFKNKSQNNKRLVNELSEREKEVLKLATNGNKTKEIASILEISFQTIKIHRRNIIRKLGVKSTIDAIRLFEKVQERA